MSIKKSRSDGALIDMEQLGDLSMRVKSAIDTLSLAIHFKMVVMGIPSHG